MTEPDDEVVWRVTKKKDAEGLQLEIGDSLEDLDSLLYLPVIGEALIDFGAYVLRTCVHSAISPNPETQDKDYEFE